MQLDRSISDGTLFSETVTSPTVLRETSIPISPGLGYNQSMGNMGAFSKDTQKKVTQRRRRHNSMSLRGSMRPLLEENQKLRREMDAMENQLAEFRAVMPSIHDDIEQKTSEISYLKSTLESSQTKYQLLNERQKKMELKMSWNDEDLKEQINEMSTKNNAEKESLKDRLFQQVNRLSEELSMESHEREVAENNLVIAKQQLTKLKKDKDDERERYFYNISELERACRLASKEKNQYRMKMEEMREHVFFVDSELEKHKGLVREKEHLLQTLKEELRRREDSDSTGMKPSSVSATILTGNLALELSHNENLIAELRQERINIEEELADCKDHLEKVLGLMEYAVSAIVSDSESSDGVFQLEKAIADTRDYLGLQQIMWEENKIQEPDESEVVKSSEWVDDFALFKDENLILERRDIGTGWDDVDFGEVSVKKQNITAIEVPEEKTVNRNYAQMVEFKQEVVKEVSKIKKDILDQLNKNSPQDSLRAVIDYIEKDRKTTQKSHESLRSSELERLINASQRSLELEQHKNKELMEIMERMKKNVANSDAELKTADSEIQALRKQVQEDEIERLRLKARTEKETNDDDKKIELCWARNIATMEVTPDTSEMNIVRVHRLHTMAGLTTNQQRECVSEFFMKYSNPSTWETFKDPHLHTTIYMFDFDGSMWKTRISFLYPFVNYMTQVIGVNKKALGSVFIILPTSTVNVKIKKIASSFNQMMRTLKTHNSDGLWNYIYIFLKNVTLHYGHIKRFVGTRGRTSLERPDQPDKATIRRNTTSHGVSSKVKVKYPRSTTDYSCEMKVRGRSKRGSN